MVNNKIYLDIFEKYNFPTSRMISGSKSFYRDQHPYNLICFNGNIFIDTDMGFSKIWWGDLDISLEGNTLKKIGKEIGKTLYVVSEMEGRFGNEDNQNIKEVSVWDTTKETPYVSQELFEKYELEKQQRLEQNAKDNIEKYNNLKSISETLPIIKPKEIFGKKIINHLDFTIEEMEKFYNKLLFETKEESNQEEYKDMKWDLSFLPSNEFIDHLLFNKLNLDFDKDTLNPSSFVVGEETNSLFIKYNDMFESKLFNEDRDFLKDCLFHPYTYGSFLATCFYDYTNKKGFSNSSFVPNRIYILEDYLR